MTWVKVDDGLPEHPRWDAIGAAGLGLHVAALAYCARQLTDGRLPLSRARRLISCADVDEVIALLVADGLWELVPVESVQLTDFLIDQPSADAVRAKREEWRFVQRRKRAHNAKDHSLCTKGRFCPQGELSPGDTRTDSTAESSPPAPVPGPKDKGTRRGADALAPYGSPAVTRPKIGVRVVKQ